MGELDEILLGFSWRGGVKRDTTGIILWSDIFLHEIKGEKLAIVLMDTQGLFDPQTPATDNSRIFALGTLASSIQIFNLNDVIQENQLQYLHLATEFSKYAMKMNKKANRRAKNYRPFQHLVFLMRDWQNRQEYEYGWIGGTNYLANVLVVKDTQHEDLKAVRNFIKDSFDKTNGFLLPHPGEIVAIDSNYQGERSGLSEDFEEYLKEFLNVLLSPKSQLAKKKILNEEVTGIEYVEYLKSFIEAFMSNEIPQVDSLHSIILKKHFDIITMEAFNEFKLLIKPVEFQSTDFEGDLTNNGQLAYNGGLKSFSDKKKLGSQKDIKIYEDKLKEQMIQHLNEWKASQMRTFREMKVIEEQKKKKLEELQEKSRKELEEQQRIADEQIIKLKEDQEAHEAKMNETLYILKIETEREIENLRQQHEAQMKANKEEREKAFKQFETERDELRQKAVDAQNNLEKEILIMKANLELKQKEMDKTIDDKRDLQLEQLKIENQNRMIEFERQLKIDELRQNAINEQRIWEREKYLEEKRIREAAEADRFQETRKMMVEFAQERQLMQSLILANLRSG